MHAGEQVGTYNLHDNMELLFARYTNDTCKFNWRRIEERGTNYKFLGTHHRMSTFLARIVKSDRGELSKHYGIMSFTCENG